MIHIKSIIQLEDFAFPQTFHSQPTPKLVATEELRYAFCVLNISE